MSVIDLATYKYTLELFDKGFSSGMKNAEGQTEKLQSKFDGLTNFLKVSVIGGLAIASAAIAGTIVAGVKATADLDEQMSKFQANVGATAEETEEVRKLSQDLFRNNTASMEDIVATAAELKKSMGLNTDEIKKYQQSYMDYAKTTGQANTDVVKAIDDIGDAWDLSSEEMAKSLDMLKKSNQEFGTDLNSVQQALSSVSPAAKALGLSFEETNGIMNLFAASGLDASQAVTAFTYAAKQVKSPEEFKKMLADIQAIKDPTERAQKAVELFGARAGVGLANALDGSKSLQDFIITMDSAAGTVSNASTEFDNNLNVQIELAKKQFTGLVQELGEKFMPVINEVLKWVTANMPTIVGYIESAINSIGIIISPFIELIKNVISAFSDMEGATSTIFSSINNTITSVLTSINEFIQSFIDVVKGFWDKWGQDIVAFAQKYFEALKSNIESVLDIIKGIFNLFTSLLKGDWEGVGQALVSIAENFWSIIKNTFDMSMNAIKLLLQMAVSTFITLGKNIMNGLWQGLKFIWDKIVTWIDNSISGIIEWFNSLYDSFVNLGKTLFQGLWDGLKSIWSSIESWVSDTISWLKDKLSFWKKSKTEMTSDDSEENIPSYDVGTPFVPRDGLAMIHKGEMIVPAAYNPYNPANKGISQPIGNTNNYNIHIDKVETQDANSFIDLLPTLVVQYKDRR